MTPNPPATSAPAAAPTPAPPAGEQWYNEFGTRIYRYLRYHVASADDAEELTAETFLRAVRAAERFDPARGNPKAWLFRIAQNVLRDARRRDRRRGSVPLESFRDLVSDAPSPEERVLHEEEVRRLLTAMDGLAERDREVVSLRYGSELEYAEIASILGIREPAVRTRLWRALGRLREALTQ
jgi:RNA polymerase sigma factor (sigma-70 family)